MTCFCFSDRDGMRQGGDPRGTDAVRPRCGANASINHIKVAASAVRDCRRSGDGMNSNRHCATVDHQCQLRPCDVCRRCRPAEHHRAVTMRAICAHVCTNVCTCARAGPRRGRGVVAGRSRGGRGAVAGRPWSPLVKLLVGLRGSHLWN